MKWRWRQTPLFLVLLPVFFVLHGFVENFNAIGLSDCLLLIALYTGAALVIYGIFFQFYRSPAKAALLSAFCMAFFLFFGALHDLFRQHSIFLHKYSILLPLFLVALVALIVYLRKHGPFPRLIFFLNMLLLLYTLIDSGLLVKKALATSAGPQAAYSATAHHYQPCDGCPRPDIYFLLFDEYSGNKALRELYQYDNSALDSFFLGEQFRVQHNSRSNYYFTPFSMASILNFSYLQAIPDGGRISADDQINILDSIRKCEVVNFLRARGYRILNYSFFDLPGHPASFDQGFIPVKTRLITNRTLLHYLERDLQNSIWAGLWGKADFRKKRITEAFEGNIGALARTMEESRKSAADPRFVYLHVFLPHFPYLFDSLQRKKDPEVVARQMNEGEIEPYLAYLPYTNARIRELITTIKKNTDGKAVIVFMSDHGFRDSRRPGYRPYFFQNQNAVYFPDKDYHLLYDSISAVNEFRVVFNKLFRQDLPLLKDSVIYLTEQPQNPMPR